MVWICLYIFFLLLSSRMAEVFLAETSRPIPQPGFSGIENGIGAALLFSKLMLIDFKVSLKFFSFRIIKQCNYYLVEWFVYIQFNTLNTGKTIYCICVLVLFGRVNVFLAYSSFLLPSVHIHSYIPIYFNNLTKFTERNRYKMTELDLFCKFTD